MDPVNLFCTYIRKLNRLFFSRRQELALLPPNSLPRNVDMMLSKSIEESWELDVLQNSMNIFEVQRRGCRLPFRVVDLGKMSCSCGFFREQGIPCRHIARQSSRGGSTQKRLSFRRGALTNCEQPTAATLCLSISVFSKTMACERLHKQRNGDSQGEENPFCCRETPQEECDLQPLRCTWPQQTIL